MASRAAVTDQDQAVIADQNAFDALMKRARRARRVALDTEAASFHRYFDRIYLIQVSTESETAVVDPLEVSNPSLLGELLADSKVEIVFHDSDYDLRVLHRDYKFEACRLFDTRVAAQLLGEPGVGLGSLLEKHFNVRLNKRMQRADWSRRPLTDEMIRYAADDTRYLLDLRDTLAAKLTKAGRLHWAQEEFERLQHVTWTPQNHEGNAFLKVKGARALKPKAMAVLRSLHEWREKEAAKADRAPFRILGNDALITLATNAPTRLAALEKTKGVPDSARRRHAEEMLTAIESALQLSPDQYPKPERPKRAKPDPAADARLEKLKALRNRRAKSLGLEPGVICPNGTLQAIARAAPRGTEQLLAIKDLRMWQVEALGEAEILKSVGGGI